MGTERIIYTWNTVRYLETIYTPYGDGNFAVTLLSFVTVIFETIYTPYGDGNVSFSVLGFLLPTETIYSPYGDGNSSVDKSFLGFEGNNLHPLRGRKLMFVLRFYILPVKQSTPLMGTVLPFSDKTLAEKACCANACKNRQNNKTPHRFCPGEGLTYQNFLKYVAAP